MTRFIPPNDELLEDMRARPPLPSTAPRWRRWLRGLLDWRAPIDVLVLWAKARR